VRGQAGHSDVKPSGFARVSSWQENQRHVTRGVRERDRRAHFLPFDASPFVRVDVTRHVGVCVLAGKVRGIGRTDMKICSNRETYISTVSYIYMR